MRTAALLRRRPPSSPVDATQRLLPWKPRANSSRSNPNRRNYVASRRLSSSAPDRHYDVVIAGGGAVGSVLARLLLDDSLGRSHGGAEANEHRRRPLKVALLERRPAPPPLEDLVVRERPSEDGQPRRAPHPRAYALSPASLSYLGESALRSLVRYNLCGVYDTMQVWESDGPAQLHFAGEDLAGAVEEGRLVDLDRCLNGADGARNATAPRKPWLGAVVEDAPLVSSLWDELRRDDRIDLLDDVRITSIEAPSPADMGKVDPPPPVEISYARSDDDGGAEERALSADLLVAADGANSLVRRSVGRFPMTTRTYGRKAVTCTVRLESGMARTAFQRFLPHGPIALLPVWNSADDANEEGDDGRRPIYANVVWSTTPSEANYLLSLSASDFVSTLNRRLRQGPNANASLLSGSKADGLSIPFLPTVAKEVDSLLRAANAGLTMGTWTESPSRNYFRTPPKSIGVASPVLGFDLAASHVAASGLGTDRINGGYASPRVALVGDAAHTMHPMAGQGLNLGLDDVRSLSALVREAADSGMDVGGTDLFLDRYNRERLVKGWGVVGGVHALHEMFGCGDGVPGGVADGSCDGDGGAGGLRRLIGFGRSLGMNAVNGLPVIRQILAEVAAGASPRGFK
ncbi:hypothetical protein ACHAWF_015888 [Thalassiosira exigua]